MGSYQNPICYRLDGDDFSITDCLYVTYMYLLNCRHQEVCTSTPRAKRFLDFIGFGKKPSDELISKLLNDYLRKSK